jgi:hypothetical protein
MLLPGFDLIEGICTERIRRIVTDRSSDRTTTNPFSGRQRSRSCLLLPLFPEEKEAGAAPFISGTQKNFQAAGIEPWRSIGYEGRSGDFPQESPKTPQIPTRKRRPAKLSSTYVGWLGAVQSRPDFREHSCLLERQIPSRLSFAPKPGVAFGGAAEEWSAFFT